MGPIAYCRSPQMIMAKLPMAPVEARTFPLATSTSFYPPAGTNSPFPQEHRTAIAKVQNLPSEYGFRRRWRREGDGCREQPPQQDSPQEPTTVPGNPSEAPSKMFHLHKTPYSFVSSVRPCHTDDLASLRLVHTGIHRLPTRAGLPAGAPRRHRHPPHVSPAPRIR
jgi:hypothetical protein